MLGAPFGRLLGFRADLRPGRRASSHPRLREERDALSSPPWTQLSPDPGCRRGWGVDTVKINAMRRAGELLAVRPAGSQEWLFPAWQFGPDGHVRPEVARVLERRVSAGCVPSRSADCSSGEAA